MRSNRSSRPPTRWRDRRRNSPTARRARTGTVRAVRCSARRATRRARGTRVRTVRPTCRRGPRGRAPTPPSPRRGGSDQQELELGERADCLRVPPQRVRREAARARRRRSRTGRTGSGTAPGLALGGHHHRGHCGVRLAVHVGGPVEQLRGRDCLGDQAEERQFDVTGAQHGARFGVLEAGGRVVERIVCGQERSDAAREFLVRVRWPIHSAPVAGATLPESIRSLSLTDPLKTNSGPACHVGGRKAANSSVTR